MRKYFYLILTILAWSATPAVAKLALSELDNFQLLFYTSIIGVISLFFINLFQKKIRILTQYSIKDYIIMFGMGFVGIYLYYIFLFGAFIFAPAGQVNVVNYLWPLFIILFSIPILKEKFNTTTIVASGISFLGAFIAFTQGRLMFDNEFLIGYFLALLGAVCYGIFSVLGKKLKYDKYLSMLVYYFLATILIIPTVMATSEIIIPKSVTVIIAVLLLGGIMNSIIFVFWFKALEKGDTHKTANAIYLVPFIAMIWTFLLNSEPFSIYSITGLTLIIAGILMQLRNKVVT